ncbi:aldehyde dehydrogenase [Phaeobacter gallaeciensis]|uniref:Aldehyde dehydrogenase n=2 Tax=Roseobacteraceae TaxID=2854170 RepID=A0A366X1U8_9RHOB|nr:MULTISPECIES: aldehyde dehydrogenase [Roseobacteraceae]MBT3141295.1 aldehyde dehydrogenase [Falsiruegeria litorea]MBT8166745.1 aldehyde dehydrogenase [Falsiruegeria litorea]RBW56169.1 aldehyde dehydrogenase [Phaeobacter gallaeciensis]
MDQTSIDALRALPVSPRGHFIDGQSVPAIEGGMRDVISPIDGQVLTQIAEGSPADMERAITSARAAFEDGRWSRMAPAARKKVLLKLADLIEAQALELAVLGVRDNGTEINMAIKAESMSAAATFRYYGEAIDKVYGQIAPTAENVLGLVHHAPVGVVGAIVPWNFPLMIGSWKIAPALAAGNSIVLKPAESASLSLLRIAELASEAGVPDGVFNVVTGKGSVVGETLALSMDVDIMVFTGSGATGRRLLEYSARSNLKRCYLELGGKSPNIIFNDAPDLAHAAQVSAGGIFRNSGQVCVAGSRLLVQEDIHDDFVAEICKHAEAFRVGNPLDLNSQIGAVHSLDELEANLDFVTKAEAEGASRLSGGNRILSKTGGYYMQPTVMGGVKPTDTLAQQEVFGPVLAVTPFKDEAEAIQIANSTVYGLSAGVWTSNLGRAHRMVAGIRSGIIHVNTYGGSDLTVPLGGVGQSGNGHDKSLHAMDKYFDLKTAWIQL